MFLCVVRLRGLRLDRDRRVATLVKLRPVGDRTYHVAGAQSERRSQCRQGCDQHGDDDLDNLLLGHSAYSKLGLTYFCATVYANRLVYLLCALKAASSVARSEGSARAVRAA